MIADIQKRLKAGEALAIQGFGSKSLLGPKAQGTPFCMAGLSGIDFFYPQERVISALSGTPFAEIEATLAAQNHRLAFDPPKLFAPQSLGGVVASGISGSRRAFCGGIRDHLLGLSFINGRGDVIRSGGRVMKNVTGYDVPKLFCGSWGTLGIMTHITLKTVPIPPLRRSCVFTVESLDEGLKLVCQASKSDCDPVSIAFLPKARLGFSGPTVLVEIEGLLQSVALRSARLEKWLGRKAEYVDQEASAFIWRHICDAEPLLGPCRQLLRIRCAPRAALHVAQKLEARHLLFDWAGALIWARDPRLSLEELRKRLPKAQITQIKGPNANAAFQPPDTQSLVLMKTIKKAFDPKGLLNAGRFLL